MKYLPLAAVSLGLSVSGAAHAGDWVVTIGAKTTTAPPYEGADHDVIRPTPTLNVRRADRPYRFVPPDGGTTFALIDTDHFVMGPMARFQYKRDSSGDLKGLQNIGWAAEPGVFVDVWPFKWLRGRVEGRRGVVGHDGFVGDAGVDLVYNARRWNASVGGRMGWGDDNYMDKYFGVSPQEAARSPIINEVYNPSAGQRYKGVELAAAYHIDDKWTVTADFGYHRLSGKAADSPIVQLVGDDDQYAGSIGVSYAFNLHL